ncbi:YDG domain-containing protein, partial [Hyphomonas beringensis]|uniref:YDG domain-containing protein n=1 Tax=Hyphomonas beringensis TaxID=1280946 RepID=UPI000557947E
SVVDRPYDGTTRVELTGAQLANAVASDLAGGTVALDSSTEYGVMSDKNARANKLLTAQYELTGADQDNYILTLPTDLTADIAKAQLTVTGTLTAEDRPYNGMTTATIDTSNLSLSDYVAGDELTLELANATGSFVDANAGVAKTVTLSTSGSLGGADRENYEIVSNAPTTTATITPKLLTVDGVTVAPRTYDATAIADLLGGT